ncbi:hypothetical protein L1987_23682 [Smallanthus sonchifolius]|uniref:Uncharacterized protein n=1 Tax=Smallanthus sonchifolius TaxID=185202 RepID=A0ACB9IJ81_9ASTR|nr:hypothetical protein L1987_23682 [Smallanthus sonchifolius]
MSAALQISCCNLDSGSGSKSYFSCKILLLTYAKFPSELGESALPRPQPNHRRLRLVSSKRSASCATTTTTTGSK